MPCGEPRSARWKSRNTWSSVTISLFLRATKREWSARLRAPADSTASRTGCGTTRPWCSRVPVKCSRRGSCGGAQSHWRSRRATANEPRSTRARRRSAKRIRECSGGEAARCGGTRPRERARCGVFLCIRAGALRRVYGVSKAGRRTGETVAGGYAGAIRVSAHSARALRTRSSGAVRCGRVFGTGASLRFRAAGHWVLCQIRGPLPRVCPRAVIPCRQDVAKRP